MQQITFRDVIYSNGKTICDCIIKKGMTLEESLAAVCNVYTSIAKGVSLDTVNLHKLGISQTCDLTYGNLLSEIINALIQADIDFSSSLETINKSISGVLSIASSFSDELAKTNKDDTTAGYLEDKIESLQPGTISVIDSVITFVGFVPIGAVMMINKSRLVDFDVTLKGKIGTDVYGYAVCNGANGTTNRLGKMIRFVESVGDAGKTGGSNTVLLKDTDIPSLTLPVSGTITDGLVDPVKPKTGYNTNKLTDGSGGSYTLLRYTPDGDGPQVVTGPALDLKHSHSFNLSASRTNATPTSISLIPSHILEIPIERITI